MLEAFFHPAAPAILLVGAIWLVNYLVRRFVPNLWERIANIPFPNGAHRPAVELARKAWQALPSVATGALLAAISTGDATNAVVGAILGLIAPVWHEALKALPVPYRGGKAPAAEPKPPASMNVVINTRAYDPWRNDITPAETFNARRKSDPPPRDGA